MKLKVKYLDWFTGFPVAMLNKFAAKQIGVRPKDRISIKLKSSKSGIISTIVDVTTKIVSRNEIGISKELKSILKIKEKDVLDISLAEMPRSLSFIHKKAKGKRLNKKEIREIIRDIVTNSLSESEIALFVLVSQERGMNIKETISLIESILENGNKINFKRKYSVDKHCIGGTPGNRTTPLVVSICAAMGFTMPKTSSRAITSAAGTADVIEIFSKIEFSESKLKSIVKKTNACMIWGGGLDLVPADSRIIKIEKMLKIDSEAQLLASIMSKKLAMGSNYILIDIPYGETAKVSLKKAKQLKKKFEKLGKYFNKKLKVVLTDGSQPIGNGIGPVLEMMDVVGVLDPKRNGPEDLEEKSVFLAGQIWNMVKNSRGGEKKAKEILKSGKAFKKFEEIMKAQGGKVRKLELAKFSKDIKVIKKCKIKKINNKEMNLLARILGCPEDKRAGVYLHRHIGDTLERGDNMITIYAESKSRLNQAIKFYKERRPIKSR